MERITRKVWKEETKVKNTLSVILMRDLDGDGNMNSVKMGRAPLIIPGGNDGKCLS